MIFASIKSTSLIFSIGTSTFGKRILEKDNLMIIVEDIIDTGRTLSYLIDIFRYRKAKSIKIVTLLDKKERRAVDLEADWVGIHVPDEFVVGYGLDFDEKYRNLPYIGVLKEEVYQ